MGAAQESLRRPDGGRLRTDAMPGRRVHLCGRFHMGAGHRGQPADQLGDRQRRHRGGSGRGEGRGDRLRHAASSPTGAQSGGGADRHLLRRGDTPLGDFVLLRGSLVEPPSGRGRGPEMRVVIYLGLFIGTTYDSVPRLRTHATYAVRPARLPLPRA